MSCYPDAPADMVKELERLRRSLDYLGRTAGENAQLRDELQRCEEEHQKELLRMQRRHAEELKRQTRHAEALQKQLGALQAESRLQQKGRPHRREAPRANPTVRDAVRAVASSWKTLLEFVPEGDERDAVDQKFQLWPRLMLSTHPDKHDTEKAKTLLNDVFLAVHELRPLRERTPCQR